MHTVSDCSRPRSALGAVGEGLAELSVTDDGPSIALGWGGDAANLCVMAARLGASARLAGRVGRDAFGRRLTAFWQSNGVDVRWIREDSDGPTGLYLNEPSADGGHRFTYWRTSSAGSRVAPQDIPPTFVDGLGALAVTGVTLAVSRSSAVAARAAIALARAHGTRIACVVNHRPSLGGDVDELAELAASSDMLIASQEDLQAVFGTADPATLAPRLDPGPSEIVVTAGAARAQVICGDRIVSQAVPSAVVRNAAGAGDALAGAYLGARIQGETPARSLAWGVAAATLSVGRDGCATAYPNRTETTAVLETLPPPSSSPLA